MLLDELGNLQFSANGGALLFHLSSKLYEKTSPDRNDRCDIVATGNDS